MRCAVFIKSNMPTRGKHSSKSKSASLTKVSSATGVSSQSDTTVTVVDTGNNGTTAHRQSTRQQQQRNSAGVMLHKPVKSETLVNKKGNHRSTGGGRHLQPPSGNNTKLKHECPFDGCPWRFATPYKLRRHIKSHTKETPYQCKECGRGFSVRYNLLMHIQTIHSTPHKYKCPVTGCKEAFHTQPRLNGHLRKIHKKDWKQFQAEIKDNSTKASVNGDSTTATTGNTAGTATTKATPTTTGRSTKWHKCMDCNKEFTSQAKLSAHMKAHSGNFRCTVQGCSRSFQTAEKLTKHLNSSHKSLPCPSKGCNRVFLKQSQLKNHVRVHSSKHTCPKENCNQKFDNEVDYNDHVAIHTGCSILCPFEQCGLTFPTQKRLELHYRVAHLINETTTTTEESTDTILPSSSSVDSVTGNTDGMANSASDNEERIEDKLTSDTTGGNFMNAFELPDLKVEDIEAVMLEHTTWTGDQIETFLKTLDIGELEGASSLKSSLSGYESDSGYSTHEVSPIGLPPLAAHHYASALSPAITPVTPSPILSLSSSASSPTPFCGLYPEDIFASIHCTTPTTSTSSNNSAQSANDHHHFFGSADFALLQSLSAQNEQQHLFQQPPLPNPALYSNPLQLPPSSQIPAAATTPPATASKTTCIQSVLPPISNVPDIEASSHDVTVIPNSFCSSSNCISPTTDCCKSVTSYPPINPQCIETASQFDSFLDGYFNIKTTTNNNGDQQQLITSSPATSDVTMTSQTDDSMIISASDSTPNQQSPLNNVICKTDKPSSPSDDCKMTRNSSQKLVSVSADNQTAIILPSLSSPPSSEPPRSSPDNGRMVIAQVLTSPSKKSQPLLINAGINNSLNKSGSSGARSSKVKVKGRHHSASAAMKGHQKGKRKGANWPKSMNSGNLMAFRNFILSKLKHTSPPPPSSPYSFPSPSSVNHGDSAPHSVPPTPSFYSPVATPSDDIFSDIGFNPDTLLSSDQSMDTSCFSPFSHHSGSISPSPVPVSPQFNSLTSNQSPSSSTAGGEGNLDIDGFIHCLSVDPVNQEFEAAFRSQLGEDFCNILKTDSDPLLGGLS